MPVRILALLSSRQAMLLQKQIVPSLLSRPCRPSQSCAIRRLCFSHHAECRVLPALQAQGTLAALAFPA